MASEEPGGGTATIDDITCVMDELEAPESVLAQMGSTRALDGMQSATWSTYKATWTYHPDDGLDLIITYVSRRCGGMITFIGTTSPTGCSTTSTHACPTTRLASRSQETDDHEARHGTLE